MVEQIVSMIKGLDAEDLLTLQNRLGLNDVALVTMMRTVTGLVDILDARWARVYLAGCEKKIQLIKVIRDHTHIGLKHAKEVSESTRDLDLEQISSATRRVLIQEITALGAQIEAVRPDDVIRTGPDQ